MSSYYYYTRDLDYPLCYPHYSDSHFKGNGILIFGTDKGEQSEYSDRLWEWDRAKAKTASEQCEKEFKKNHTARRTQRFLSLYFNREVNLHGIIAGTRPFDGYNWYCYRFDFVNQDTTPTTQKP